MASVFQGHFFEDFALQQELVHPLPRTISEGDVSLYIALTGSRFALHASDTFAKTCGYARRPIDDILLFHIAFGKTVHDISLNAIANLGYAEVHFPTPAYVGDTVQSRSTVIGLKENSNKKSGIVYVHSQAYNQHGACVLDLKRWVMVRKRDGSSSDINAVPTLAPALSHDRALAIPAIANFDQVLSGSANFFESYAVGERINHPEGITIDESDHTLATKLYQNDAKLHFDAHMMEKTPMKRRLIYGGHIISLCRSISHNGLGNAMWVYAIHAGAHANPCFAGDTIYAYSIVEDVIECARDDLGMLRIQTIGLKNCEAHEIADAKVDGRYLPAVVLDLQYTLLVPKRAACINS